MCLLCPYLFILTLVKHLSIHVTQTIKIKFVHQAQNFQWMLQSEKELSFDFIWLMICRLLPPHEKICESFWTRRSVDYTFRHKHPRDELNWQEPLQLQTKPNEITNPGINISNRAHRQNDAVWKRKLCKINLLLKCLRLFWVSENAENTFWSRISAPHAIWIHSRLLGAEIL